MENKNRILVWGSIVIMGLTIFIAPFSPIALPFTEIAYGLLAVIGMYTGVSQLSAIVVSKKMPDGKVFTGNKDRLFQMIIAILFLVLASLIMQLIFRQIEYPLGTLVITAFTMIALFVGGEQGKHAVKDKNEVKVDEIEAKR